MLYNYSKLIGRMAELKISQDTLAKRMGIGRSTLFNKLRSNTEFTQDEINACVKILNLKQAEIPEYFFTINV